MPFSTIQLSDGSEIPAIAFGTGSARYGQDATTYVKQALSAGFIHVDTAQIYKNEDSVGVALDQFGVARNDVYITTKYGSGDIKTALQQSLKKLNVKYVDLYLIHNPRSVIDDIPGAWKQLESFVDAGLVKSIGVSNFEVEHLQQVLSVARIKPVVNQISLNPYNYHAKLDLLKFSAQHDIVIEAYSSLVPITRSPGGPVDKPLADAARRIGGTPAQVIFSWLASKGIVIVTTSSSSSRLKEYLATADLPVLTHDEIAAIEHAGAQKFPGVTRR